MADEDVADSMMDRGSYLRKMRLLAMQDEKERQREKDPENEPWESRKHNDGNLLVYESFLQNQYSFDDLKHIDFKYIDYGNVIIEQDKSLGKGGFCWDAAYILGTYVAARRDEWLTGTTNCKVMELGCGTGLSGILLAQSLMNEVPNDLLVLLTDLPSLLPLMRRNLEANFYRTQDTIPVLNTSEHVSLYGSDKTEKVKVAAHVLDWAEIQEDSPTFDVILGADVVASLYDPVALAFTLYCLANQDTKIYISFKERLSSIHRTFEAELERLFGSVEFRTPTLADSRNQNPDVRILFATDRRKSATQRTSEA